MGYKLGVMDIMDQLTREIIPDQLIQDGSVDDPRVQELWTALEKNAVETVRGLPASGEA